MNTKSTVPHIDASLLYKAGDLKKRIFFTLLVLVVYRFGSYIPVPGVDAFVLKSFAESNSDGILGMFNMLSGGSLGRMSIFALSIMPYITASIILQLMTVISKNLESLKKEGDIGRQKISQYTRYATVLLAAIQGFGIAAGLESMTDQGSSVVVNPGAFFKATAVISLTSGTVFLMWLGEQITARGIGNGISLIIFSGIVAGLPNALAGTLELGKTGAISELFIVFLFLLAISVIAVIVFFEKSHRKILVQYPKRQLGNKIYSGDNSHIPLKLNTSGVIPPIFASSILLFPLTIGNFTKGTGSDSQFLQTVISYLSHGKPLYMLMYVFFIVFFAFFYNSIVFNANETAENLRKYGGFIPGRRPGKSTATYLSDILTRLTVIGSTYLAIICVIPEILIANYSVPFYLGGTSILIVVNVVIDTMSQVQTHLFSHQYEGLMNKMRTKQRRR